MKTFREYEDAAAETDIYPGSGTGSEAAINYCVAGLCEVAGKWKKYLRRDKGAMPSNMLMELGDVLWYASRLASELGSSLEDVAILNVLKLRARQFSGTIQGDGDNR